MSFASEWRRKRETAASAAPAALVEKATSDLLAEPDWAANMDVCDLINSDLRQAREAIKAVKKRLVHRSPMVQFLALTLLETMVKNCGDYVHLQVVECEVLDEMVRIVKKKGWRMHRNCQVVVEQSLTFGDAFKSLNRTNFGARKVWQCRFGVGKVANEWLAAATGCMVELIE